MHAPRRRLTILDMVIVVASVAIGLALLKVRIAFADVPLWFTSVFSTAPWRWSPQVASLRLSGLLELAIPCALAGTLGTLVLRLLPPRPGLSRLARQPGFVACATFLTVAGLASLAVLATLGLRGRFNDPARRDLIVYYCIATLLMVQLGGWSVAAGWFVLKLSGRYRPEASWVDRLGRAFGLFWIVTAIVLTDLLNATVLRL